MTARIFLSASNSSRRGKRGGGCFSSLPAAAATLSYLPHVAADPGPAGFRCPTAEMAVLEVSCRGGLSGWRAAMATSFAGPVLSAPAAPVPAAGAIQGVV
jgi:hypothetical protein